MHKKSLKVLLKVALILSVGILTPLFAPAPNCINYQGRLREHGQPVSGTRVMNFRIYNVPTGGIPVWESTPQDIQVSTGIFSYQLQPTGIDWSTGEYYMELVIGTTALSPRERLVSSPYALYSNDSDKLDGRDYTAYVSTQAENQTIAGVKTFTSTTVFQSNVGIGTTGPDRRLDVHGGAVVRSSMVVTGAIGLSGTMPVFQVAGSTMIVRYDGNVGIGTTNPGVKLDVAGSINQVATKVRATRTTGQTIPSGIVTKVQFDNETYDALSEYDNTTNFRFTATTSGYYFVSGTIYWRLNINGNVGQLHLRRNGSDVNIARNAAADGSDAEFSVTITDVIFLNAGDYLEWFAWQNSGVDRSFFPSPRSWMVIERIP